MSHIEKANRQKSAASELRPAGKRVGGSQNDPHQDNNQRRLAGWGWLMAEPQPSNDHRQKWQCAGQQYSRMCGRRHAESRVHRNCIADAAGEGKQRDHPEWWQRDSRQEKDGNYRTHAKTQRRDVPTGKRTSSAMTGNKNEARPDAYGKKNRNPAATGICCRAHDVEEPVYSSVVEWETYMEVSLSGADP